MRRGAYCLADQWDAATEAERRWLTDVAAHLTTTTPHLLSHDSAARALALPMLEPRRVLVHVTRPGVGGSRTEHGVKHHLARVSPRSRAVVEGLAITGLARTGLDMAREHGLMCGLVVLDACRRRGMTEQDAAAELALMRSWPGVRTARTALALSDGRAESPGETLLRLLVHEMGLGPIRPQFAVPLPAGAAWCDLVVGRHAFEFDGRVKYLPVSDGGLATRSASEVVWDEKVRERGIASLGMGISRVTWEDVRFGDRLPDELEIFAREHPRRAA